MSIVFIPLTQGEVAVIDQEDWPFVSRYKWSAARRRSTCYAQTWRGNQREDTFEIVLMHRLILNAPRGAVVDHRDHNGLNNRRSNIRLASLSQNQANRKPNRGSQTGLKGVRWNEAMRKYTAEIRLNRRNRYLGSYEAAEDAARAYDAKARELFGEFACLNFPD